MYTHTVGGLQTTDGCPEICQCDKLLPSVKQGEQCEFVSPWHAGKLFSPAFFCFLAVYAQQRFGKVKVISSKITHLRLAEMLVTVKHLSMKQVHLGLFRGLN